MLGMSLDRSRMSSGSRLVISFISWSSADRAVATRNTRGQRLALRVVCPPRGQNRARAMDGPTFSGFAEMRCRLVRAGFQIFVLHQKSLRQLADFCL